LDLKGGKMAVSTTDKTYDPFIIIKARDMCQLMSRGITFEQAKRVLDDGVFSDIIKIGSFTVDADRFRRRRQRLLGPNGATLKALELLTGCYIFIQGKTACVIGDIKGMKQARKVIEDCMQNIHPVYHIKELMIRKQLEKRPELANEDWSKFLPKFKKNIRSTNKPKKKKIDKKKKKEYTPFPEPIEKSKVDLMLESGEYFLSEEQKKQKRSKEQKQKSKAKSLENQEKKLDKYIPPVEETKTSTSAASTTAVDVHALASKIKQQHETQQKKRKASEMSKSVTAQDFVQSNKRQKRKN
jgi:ribosomal RNA assembly protein